MPDIKIEYDTKSSLVSQLVADSASYETSNINNSVSNYTDIFVLLEATGATSSAVDTLLIFAYGSVGDEIYTQGLDGQASAAPDPIMTFPFVGIDVDGTNSVYAGPYSLANAFGGKLPEKTGLHIYNESGAGVTVSANIQGIYKTIA